MRSDCWHWYQVPPCCWAVHLAARWEDRVRSSQQGFCHCALREGWREIWTDIQDNIGINRILWCRHHIGITVEHDDIWGGQVESFRGHGVPWWSSRSFPGFCISLGHVQGTNPRGACLCELLVDKLWEAGTPYFQTVCPKLHLTKSVSSLFSILFLWSDQWVCWIKSRLHKQYHVVENHGAHIDEVPIHLIFTMLFTKFLEK